MEASTLQAPVALNRISVSVPLLRLRSDEQLVALFRAGSDDAFRAIHDRYRARLLAYSRQMLGGCSHDAEDALQDVFVRAYAALRTSNRPISLRAWLYRVAHNRCIDQLRRPMPEACDVFDVSRPPAHDPPLETERREQLRRLVIDVGRLPDQQRSALLMREMQGMSYEEMAHAMDVSVAAIKSLLVRARGGLVDSADARDAACTAVRREVALACDRGVRGSGLVRRHLRDCPGCREYRDRLRGARRRLAALLPVGPLGVVAQALGVGGTSGAAVAGGAGAIGGGTLGGAGVLGGAGAFLAATKVALVCAAAVTAGTGALEAARHGPHRASAGATSSRAIAHRSAADSAAAASAQLAPASPPALEGPSAAPGASPASLAPMALTGVRPAPAPTTHARRHAATPPQFVTGQDFYPTDVTQTSATGSPSGQTAGGGTAGAGTATAAPGGGSTTTTAADRSGGSSSAGSATSSPSSGTASGGGQKFSSDGAGQKAATGSSGTSTTGSQGGATPPPGQPQGSGTGAGSGPAASASTAPAGTGTDPGPRA